MIHLDTSFLIRGLMVGSDEDLQLRQWISDNESLGMCTIAWSEFLCGPVGDDVSELAMVVIQQLIAFSHRHAAVSADLFNVTGRRRGSMIDCMIAATAICENASIATVNTQDFKRFESAGLQLALI